MNCCTYISFLPPPISTQITWHGCYISFVSYGDEDMWRRSFFYKCTITTQPRKRSSTEIMLSCTRVPYRLWITSTRVRILKPVQTLITRELKHPLIPTLATTFEIKIVEHSVGLSFFFISANIQQRITSLLRLNTSLATEFMCAKHYIGFHRTSVLLSYCFCLIMPYHSKS